MGQSNKSVSPLRQRMIEDMTLRKLGPSTQTGYIRAVVKFTRYLGRSPDTAEAEDLRRFQLQMVEDGTSSITINATLTGLKFFFEQILNLFRCSVMGQFWLSGSIAGEECLKLPDKARRALSGRNMAFYTWMYVQ